MLGLGHPLGFKYLKEQDENFWTNSKTIIGLGHPLRLDYLKENTVELQTSGDSQKQTLYGLSYLLGLNSWKKWGNLTFSEQTQKLNITWVGSPFRI